MKLTIICDVSHLISYTWPSSPLFFSGNIERKAWEQGMEKCIIDMTALILSSSTIYCMHDKYLVATMVAITKN